jgi:anthranilate phosphoribosyltransferase
VRVVSAGQVTSAIWTPADLGLAPCELGELQAADPAGSAAIIRQVLAGEEGAPLRVVLANAAAGLLTAGKVTTLPEGVEKARQAVVSGKAAGVLERLIAVCQF